MATTIQQIPTHVAKIFARDPRIVAVREYEDGFVPNSYYWPAPGTAREWVVQEDGTVKEFTLVYDRKRSFGRGPKLVGYSERRGRLASIW